jgi:hypothetical protein
MSLMETRPGVRESGVVNRADFLEGNCFLEKHRGFAGVGSRPFP